MDAAAIPASDPPRSPPMPEISCGLAELRAKISAYLRPEDVVPARTFLEGVLAGTAP